LLSSLLQLISLDSKDAILLCIAHVLALQDLVDLCTIEKMVIPLAFSFSFRLHLSEVVFSRRFLGLITILSLHQINWLCWFVVDASSHLELLLLSGRLNNILRLRAEARYTDSLRLFRYLRALAFICNERI
jgi:hypothetical protein